MCFLMMITYEGTSLPKCHPSFITVLPPLSLSPVCLHLQTRYLGRHCPHLTAISCCYAADRLYGGTLLDASLGSLFAGVPMLAHLTLLNVDVTDGVLQQLARYCPLLQHLAIGRTENNAFGNFVSDAGLTVLAAACHKLDSLCLFRCYSCSDAGLAELTQQGRQLTKLVLHSCPQVR